MTEATETRPEHALEQGFRLGELRISPNDGVAAGPGGSEKLDPKVMDVLVMLARHAGHVVLREDLLSRLWPNTVVTDDVLSRCIYELRRQLSLAGGDEQLKALIETVPKRGYRLNAAITPTEFPAGPQPKAGSKRRVLAAAAAVAVVIVLAIAVGKRFVVAPSPPGASNSIAVLPFVDMSPGRDQQYFSDGIAAEILDRLARSRELRVISRTSSFSFRDRPVEIPEIAAALNVTHVLEGSVRRSGNRVRITAQLAEASSNSQVWSETYVRELGDLFAIQDEIAASVASALRVTLASAASRGAREVNIEAHELYLQGKFFYDRRAPGDIELAVKYYQQALAIEPDDAAAWAALAGAYSLLASEGGIPREAGLTKQGEAARKTVELDPNLAVGLARLSQYYWDIGDRETSYNVFHRALAIDPDDLLVLNFAAGIAMRNGDIEGAIQRYRRIVARDPRSASQRANLGIYLLAAGKLEEAKAELLKALELNPNFGWGIDLQIARILVLQRKFEEAAAVIERLPEGDARDHGLALLSHAMGRRAETDAAVGRLAAQSSASPDIRLAEVYAFRGMKEEAFRALQGIEQAVERDEPSNASQLWSWQVELRVSPFLTPLHDDPRWAAMLVEPR